ncbi:MAG: ABC transporter ATP-binding protein, partial [Coriobacteriia bacterium]|nr:ABC transporter ATP-binding protein [Coriobacteriia bacterium]
MNNYAIVAEGLSKRFGKKQVLTDFSFTIDAVGITGLLGRNGSGKTTLMKICAGHITKTSGELKVWGATPLNNLSARSRLVYSSHDVSYSGGLTLGVILADYQLLFPDFDMLFAQKLLDYFTINVNGKYSKASQGVKSLFNFICALAARTPLTMFDEPTLGMDTTVRKAVCEILIREYNEHPRAFVISSHLMSEMESFLDAVMIIDQGNLVLHESVDTMRQKAYQLEGEAEVLNAFIAGRNVIYRTRSELTNLAIIYEAACDQTIIEACAAGLLLKGLSPESLYMYLSR